TTIPSADLRYYSNDYLGNTGIAPENKELTEDTTLHARWLPFTVGSYVDATNGTLGNLVEGTTNVHYPAFAGYKYIQFKDAAAYNGYPLRWMIIGAGENKNSALAGADISQITSYAFDGNVNGKEGNNKELGAGQVLVLSEQVLRQNSFHSSSGVWEVSIVRDVLNGDFITDTNSNLNDYIGTYIVQPNKKLNTAYTSGSAVVNSIDTTATNGGSSYIFLLGSRFGGLVGDGNTASINAEIGKESSVAAATKEMYYVQNFVVEDYLGTQDVAAENVTEVTKTIDGVEYIYSGGGDYIRGTGTAPKLASFTGVIPSYWWLRSGYCYDREGEYVVNHGGFVEYKYADKILGVRPSFVLNLA
ncbi:MAG: hypothetical protein IKT27_01500, partial [Clostridia bacterium]|nr:hypothetical protein [Clostridia bacterium]